MNRLSKLLFLAFTCTLLFNACSDYNKVLKSESVDKKYEAALKYYEKKDYYRAGELLNDVIPLLAGRVEAEKAQYLYAYTQFHQQLYLSSAQLFQNFHNTFGRSPDAEEALFLHVKSLYYDSPEYNLDQSSTTNAISSIQEFLNQYPESKFRDEASKMYDELAAKLEKKAFEGAKLYSQMRYYQSAVTAFNTFSNAYPSSLYNEEAAYLKIVAQYAWADESVTEKQRERYLETVAFYQAFIDKFPKSRYLKDAENIFDKTSRKLEKIKAPSATAASPIN